MFGLPLVFQDISPRIESAVLTCSPSPNVHASAGLTGMLNDPLLDVYDATCRCMDTS